MDAAEPLPEVVIADLGRMLAGARAGMGRLRHIVSCLIEGFGLAEPLSRMSDAELAQLGLSSAEIRELRDLLKPLRNFSWLEGYRVAGCARPPSRAGVAALAAEGIGTLITLTEEPLPPEWLDDVDLEAIHIPMPDIGTQQTASLRQAAMAMEKALEDGRAVAVHCQAGIGRTGGVLAAFFVARGMDADQAMETVKRLRPTSSFSAHAGEALRQLAQELRAR